MAVLSPQRVWPNSRVPYTAPAEVEAWLLEINAAIGFPLLVPKGISDTDYVSASMGFGRSETIGYQKNKGEHKISASDKFSMQHELLHVLGFHHEQLHRDGPWAAFGTKASSAERIDKKLLELWGVNMLPSEARIATPAPVEKKPATDEGPAKKKASPEVGHRRRQSISSGETPKRATNEEAMEQHKRAYDAALQDNNVVHHKSCDFSSVMMYGEMRNAVKSCGFQMVSTGKHAKAPNLSLGDVDALKHLYECKILALYTPLTVTA